MVWEGQIGVDAGVPGARGRLKGGEEETGRLRGMEDATISRGGARGVAETPGSMPAVRKAARLLKFLGRAPHPLGVTELSRLSGTHKSTVSRMLRAMELEGLVVQDPLTAKFSLGPELTFLGVYRFERGGLAAMARPYLERLQAATRETVSLDIFDGEKVVALDWIQSDLPVSYRSDPARPGPIHCTAAGRVLLAYQPEETIERVLGRPLSPCAGRTRTDPEAVWAELERVRRQSRYAGDPPPRRRGTRRWVRWRSSRGWCCRRAVMPAG